jgi:lipid-binding SYLF domain-containing protein
MPVYAEESRYDTLPFLCVKPLGIIMRKQLLIGLVMLLLPFSNAFADRFQDAIEVFRNAGESGTFFNNSYGYAVFPSVGRAGIGIGGARGTGRVFVDGKHVGDSTMTQLTVGLQLGAQSYSMIVFFEDERAFKEFSTGTFEFSAQAKAVAITAGASATASSAGSSAGVSGGRNDAATVGGYNRGLAIFTVARGGLMYEASVGGARFSFTPVAAR